MTTSVAVVEEYVEIVAEITNNTKELPELSYLRFYAMMSYAEYVVFEYEVQNGLRSINDPYEITMK